MRSSHKLDGSDRKRSASRYAPYVFTDMGAPIEANVNQPNNQKKSLNLNVKILKKKTATMICEGGGGCDRAGNPAVAFH